MRTEYIEGTYLASSQIESVNLCSPCLCGEQLVIRYKGLCGSGALHVHMRFSDHEVQTMHREVTTSSGYWVVQLKNEAFQCRGPILGYKVELFEAGQLLDTFCHLWADPIDLTEP